MHPAKSVAAQLSPPDGGFGWVVVLGSCLIHVVADGVTYSFGAMFPVLLAVFNAGESATGAVGSTLFGVTLIIGPIAGALVNRFGCRPVTCAGGVIATLGTILSIFSPNIPVMILTFGVIGGFGFGLIYLPAIVSVTQWFEARRSLATGIAVCGSGLGTVIFGWLAPLLVDEYNWDGALLFIAGIIFNCCVFGALFRPVEYDVVAVLEPTAPEGDEDTADAESLDSPQDELTELKAIEPSPRKQKISTVSLGDRVGGNGVLSPISMLSARSETHLHFEEQKARKLSRSGASRHGSMRLTSSHGNVHGRSRLRLTEVGKDGSVTEVTEVGLTSPFTRKDALYTGSLSNMALFREDKEKYKASVLDLSKATGVEPGTVVSVEDGLSHTSVKLTWYTKATSVFAEMMDPTLLRDWVFIWFSISNFFTSLAFQVPYIYLVDKGEKEVGMPYADASWLLSIIGIANIVGRIGFGYLSDQPRVNRLWLYNIAVMIAGAAMCVMFLCDNALKLQLFATFFGTFIGAFVTLTPVILVDLFGIERLTNAFGILLLFQGIAAFAGPPLAGLMRESSGNYDTAFIAFGFMMAGSGLMLFLIPCVKSMENACMNKRRKSVGTIVQYSKTAVNGSSTAGSAQNGGPSEHVQLLGKQDGKAGLVLPQIQINDRRASATPGAVIA
ncbi:putative Monocarboxylate transporter 12 [Hypsibius exemplaris]|uniref:Monocarboxylate transporter 12 n=1 Tax=Hypsibius exemplaris TaxID=2072580 RepID=A0A9X6N9N3_HYPEX|nr:putative Monocarboxylate transporter 12 [Hypsibius exemplaris]